MKSSTPIVIVGASGFGRETADVAEASGVPIHGFLDDSPASENLDLLARRGLKFLGSVDEWCTQESRDIAYVIGIASGRVKQLISAKLDAAGHRATSVMHPAATIGADCLIDEGAVICAGVRITTNVHLGRHVHLNLNTTVGHDTRIGHYATANPSSDLAGGVRIGERVLIGSGANVLQYLSVGDDAIIGAGALVTKDVPSEVIAKGIPARW